MEEYAQRAALNEAREALVKLAKIATAAVPSSVVASIFSMGGNFAAGEKSDGTNSRRNWRKGLRRQRKGATIDEENATRPHSIGKRSLLKGKMRFS
ncbi:hypothetical protein BPOR_0883g00010 [Botrytis porri]|uniref:Uncharacterized protein n=1 Tax=Botrytis porri TaxID=87229 RepID=A0A4Z1K993_9HELO|nr:hypothetical protein BPOR_0883g00010 [Botrytis porri]